MNDIKAMLDKYTDEINVPEFVERDPVLFPRRFSQLPDIEVSAFVTAVNAWGRRDMILRDMEKLHEIMGNSPFDFVMSADLSKFDPRKAVHRTFNMYDFAYISRGLRSIYSELNSLEEYFIDNDMFDGIKKLRSDIISANKGAPQRSTKHLPDPDAGSACKRMHLFLRWMVRNDGIVDLGVWPNVSPADLYIPLDVHVGRTSRKSGLITRTRNDRKTVEELTAILRRFDPCDPVKYDFGLFGAGEAKLLS